MSAEHYQQEGEEFKCYMILQMMVLLHSDGQLRTERDGDTEKGCQKPAVQQKTTDDDDDDDDELNSNNATLIGINYPRRVSLIIITYTVSSGTLNSTIPNHTIHHHGVARPSKGSCFHQLHQQNDRPHARHADMLYGGQS